MPRTLVVVAMLAFAVGVSAQDVVTVGTVTANGPTVDVPVFIRDASGTPLGVDQPSGSRIQAFSIRVFYSPAAAVSSVTFSRAGITAGLTPVFEASPSGAGNISLIESFQESNNQIPFNLNATPGDQVAHLVFTLSASATPGTTITLTLDTSSTTLSNSGGTVSETTSNGALALVNGAITIPPLSLSLTPPAPSVSVGGTVTMSASTFNAVTTNTTVTLSSSNTAVATVPDSVLIVAGSASADFTVSGHALGTTTITATLPASAGGGTANATVTVTAAPCLMPIAPVISGPATAQAGQTYNITWAPVTGATEYVIDESTDSAFGTVTSRTVTTTTASFSHATGGVRYYYRVRARNRQETCDATSPSSAPVSVLVTAAPAPPMRVLAVVGSTPGNFGSFFKTAVQLYNPKSVTVSGKIVFHTQGVTGSAADPSLAYSIAPGKTLSFTDLLPAMGLPSGLGSADLIADATSPLPVGLARVYSDAGTAGTTGLTEEPLPVDEALQAGNAGALLAPEDTQRFRLNIGVRTLTDGVSMTVTVRDRDGITVKTVTKTLGPTFFQQVASGQFLDGYALTGGETISFAVTSGSAFVYGATTDNTTNDPSVQFARRLD